MFKAILGSFGALKLSQNGLYSKAAGRTAKRSESLDSGVVLTCILAYIGHFDLLFDQNKILHINNMVIRHET